MNFVRLLPLIAPALVALLTFANCHAMDDNDFWIIVDESRKELTATAADQSLIQEDGLRATLSRKTPADILEFRRIYFGKFDKLNSRALEAADTIITGTRSNDGFDLFRFWIISMGKTVYEMVLADPECVDQFGHLARGRDLSTDSWESAIGSVYSDFEGEAIPELNFQFRNVSWEPAETVAELKALLPGLFVRHWDEE